jgi:hypothetical protein
LKSTLGNWPLKFHFSVSQETNRHAFPSFPFPSLTLTNFLDHTRTQMVVVRCMHSFFLSEVLDCCVTLWFSFCSQPLSKSSSSGRSTSWSWMDYQQLSIFKLLYIYIYVKIFLYICIISY